jgi:hypothetical protein
MYDALEILGWFLRALGAFTFGLGVGWLVTEAMRSLEKSWPFAVAATLGMMAVFVLLGNWVRGGATIGAFALGAGAGLLVWGLGAKNTKEPPAPAKKPTTRRRTTRSRSS